MLSKISCNPHVPLAATLIDFLHFNQCIACSYYENLQSRKLEALQTRAAVEEKALEVFRAAQRDQSATLSNTSSVFAAINNAKSTAKKSDHSIAQLPVIGIIYIH